MILWKEEAHGGRATEDKVDESETQAADNDPHSDDLLGGPKQQIMIQIQMIC